MRQMEDTLKKQKLSSMLDPITTERIYGNQMPYLFSDKNYNFNTHGKFLLVDQIRHIDIDEKKRKDFWISILETLQPKDLNQKLN